MCVFITAADPQKTLSCSSPPVSALFSRMKASTPSSVSATQKSKSKHMHNLAKRGKIDQIAPYPSHDVRSIQVQTRLPPQKNSTCDPCRAHDQPACSYRMPNTTECVSDLTRRPELLQRLPPLSSDAARAYKREALTQVDDTAFLAVFELSLV